MDALIDFAVRTTSADLNIRRPWSDAELGFLRQNLGHLTFEEIGRELGRSAAAVKIKQTRSLLYAPSRRPDWLTGNQVARILCVDVHSVVALVERGFLPAERLPGTRGILQIRRLTLKRWAVNPENWIYFRPHRVRDRSLRSLIARRRERWGDEWLTAGEAARRAGVANSGTISAAIRRGHLPGRQWGNWYVKRSDLDAYGLRPGKGSAQAQVWSPQADAYILRARDELGMTWMAIAARMKWTYQRVAYRYHCLKEML